ncbi:calcium-binding protein [Rhizobium alvei]|uniref:Uncharacterized protein n=1 Tax=Rhizobium alvei TaxID=1132659 RepID=A0ABT8YIU6_9HYPH|nr:hypothetical protein [Rhizobium alvei]MDO6963617.1 hypothetical protein [Rhizobium alvei]
MTTFSITKTTGTSADTTGFTEVTDSLTDFETTVGNAHYIDCTPSSDVLFYSNYISGVYQLTFKLQGETSTSILDVRTSGIHQYVDMQHIGAVGDADVYLMSYMRDDYFYYVVWDDANNKWYDGQISNGVTSIDKIYYNTDGDIIYKYTTTSGVKYATLDSGIISNTAPSLVDYDSAISDSEALTIGVASLATDAESDALSITNVYVKSILTSDDSNGGALAAIDADGNIVFAYTGALDATTLATVTLGYTISDGTNTVDGDQIVITVEGSAATTLNLSLVQAQALIDTYGSDADLGAITAVTLADTAATIEGLSSTQLSTLRSFGVTSVDATDGELTLDISTIRNFITARVIFTADDTVSVSDTAANLATLTTTEIEFGAQAHVDSITATDGDLTLSMAQALALIAGGITVTGDNALIVTDTAAKIEALENTDLANLSSLGATIIDASDDALTVNATFIDTMVDNNLAFGSDDTVVLSLTAADAKSYSDSDLASLAAAGVDTIDISDGPKQFLASFVTALTNAGINLFDTADVFVATGRKDIFTGSAANDDITGAGGNDKLTGAAGDDSLYGNFGNDILNGNAGLDLLSGGEGNDKLFGGDDNDRLDGGTGDDRLFGDAGADQIFAGAGRDVITGGTGADTFYFLAGNGIDIIADFMGSDGVQDKIDLGKMEGIDRMADIREIASQVGDNVVINFGDGDRIILRSFDLGDLGRADFLF